MLFPHVRQPVYSLQNGQAVNTLERLSEQGPGCKAPATALLSQLNHLQGQQAAAAETSIYLPHSMHRDSTRHAGGSWRAFSDKLTAAVQTWQPLESQQPTGAGATACPPPKHSFGSFG